MKTSLTYAVVLTVAVTVSIPPSAVCQREDALIDTGNRELGKIQGTYSWTITNEGKLGRKYYWFTGIPYAFPESYTGINRFKPSEVWENRKINETGPFKANATLKVCPQTPVIDFSLGSQTAPDISSRKSFNFIKNYYSRKGVESRRSQAQADEFQNGNIWGAEDCLILSISTPRLSTNITELLPVIFFIHGGGFDAFWGNIFGGQRLLNHDVVLVTINYRLGVLGSLNLGIDEAPGDAAVYDCITALRWVQNHIHHFGGDKTKVTVSGQSAGAVLATTVLISPLAKGLFRGVIGASGSVFSAWANQDDPVPENLKMISFTSCKNLLPPNGKLPTDEEAKILRDCVGGLSLNELVYARDRYGAVEALDARLGYDAVVPSVQKGTLSIPLALNDTPGNILKHKQQSNVPLMMGATRHDGSFVMIGTYYDYLVANGLDSDVEYIRNELLPKFLKGIGIEDPTGALVHSLQKAYLGDSANSDDPLSKLAGMLDIHSAIGFKAGAYGLVEQHAKLNKNAYYYAFDYQGQFTTYDIANGVSQIPGGVAHVDDLLYLFQLLPLLRHEDWQVSQRYVDYWANFAIHGNPNGPGDLDEPFPRYNSVDHRFLIINGTDRMGFHCRDTWYGNAVELMK